MGGLITGFAGKSFQRERIGVKRYFSHLAYSPAIPKPSFNGRINLIPLNKPLAILYEVRTARCTSPDKNMLPTFSVAKEYGES